MMRVRQGEVMVGSLSAETLGVPAHPCALLHSVPSSQGAGAEVPAQGNAITVD